MRAGKGDGSAVPGVPLLTPSGITSMARLRVTGSRAAVRGSARWAALYSSPRPHLSILGGMYG
jgi:hypothetical protein